jgi:hypothetical protein
MGAGAGGFERRGFGQPYGAVRTHSSRVETP